MCGVFTNAVLMSSLKPLKKEVHEATCLPCQATWSSRRPMQHLSLSRDARIAPIAGTTARDGRYRMAK